MGLSTAKMDGKATCLGALPTLKASSMNIQDEETAMIDALPSASEVQRSVIKVDGELIISTLRNDLNSRSRQITYQMIANDTGLTVRWLEKFARGQIAKPPFAPVCCLYAYLYKTSQIKL